MAIPRSRTSNRSQARPPSQSRPRSGAPGGGKGQREEARSSIYPASGPMPRGKAVLRTEGEVGHPAGPLMVVRPQRRKPAARRK